jgi:ABC-type antimicrobial peptide transport system permease subunit
MLKNYWKVTLRNLTKNLSHTSINVMGLTLGISGATLVFLLVTHSFSFDNYHSKGNRIYRVVTQSKESTGYSETSGVPVPLTEAVINYFPEIELGSFVSYQNSGLVSIDKGDGKPQFFPESGGVVYLDSNFFKIFDRKWIKGDEKNAFVEANTVVLSERFAIKYFSTVDAVGKTLRLDNQRDLKVTGIVENFPTNSQFPFDFMISYETVRAEKNKENDNPWGSIWSDEQCYVLLHADAKAASVDEKFPAFVDKHYPQEGNFPNNSTNRFHWLQPLGELHFDTRFSNLAYNVTSKTNLISMGVIGLLLIITAAINFINLTTALAINRSKEVGVRKVMGSNRKQLILQFLGETFLITLVALVFSIGLAEILLTQALNPFMELNLKMDLLHNWQLITFFFVTLTGVSLLAGFYPSLVISRFSPVSALKNTISSRNLGGFGMRKVLVIFQFFITQLLIICTIVVMWQTKFMKQFDMGFSREAIAVVNLPVKDKNKMAALTNDLSNHSAIKKVSASAFAPASGATFGTSVSFEDASDEYGVQLKFIDPNYLDLYQIKLLAGKNIIEEDTARRILVNEAFVRHVNSTSQEMVGKVMKLNGRKVTIDGVVRDFHTNSLDSKITPVLLLYTPSQFNLIGFQVALKDWETVKVYTETKWKAQFPEYTIRLRLLEEDIAGFYEGEERMSTMAMIFAGVAIFIGCIGLYGLVMFMSKMKTKEVGIRKTLGASVINIINMFSWEFTQLVMIAFLLASPLAWWVMNKWLSNYSYHIDLDWQVFLFGLLVTIIVALLTVGHRSVKSALANPVDSLKVE